MKKRSCMKKITSGKRRNKENGKKKAASGATLTVLSNNKRKSKSWQRQDTYNNAKTMSIKMFK
jgi:hypothetical protein